MYQNDIYIHFLYCFCTMLETTVRFGLFPGKVKRLAVRSLQVLMLKVGCLMKVTMQSFWSWIEYERSPLFYVKCCQCQAHNLQIAEETFKQISAEIASSIQCHKACAGKRPARDFSIPQNWKFKGASFYKTPSRKSRHFRLWKR